MDDELDLLSTLSEILQDLGYAVVSTWDGEEAVEIAAVFDPNVLITDYRLPGIDGVTTVHRIRENRPNTRAILVSGHLTKNARLRAAQERIDRVMEKPLSITDLIRELRWVGEARQPATPNGGSNGSCP